MRRKQVIEELRRKLAWLDQRVGELIPGSGKHGALMRERVAIDVAVRELESRPHQAAAARLALKVLRTGDEDARAALGLWAEGVLVEEDLAKAENARVSGRGTGQEDEA